MKAIEFFSCLYQGIYITYPLLVIVAELELDTDKPVPVSLYVSKLRLGLGLTFKLDTILDL